MKRLSEDSAAHYADRALETMKREGWYVGTRNSSTHPIELRMMTSEEWKNGEQARAWFWESVHTVLTHPEPVISLRAFKQATCYLSQLRHEYHVSTVHESDMHTAAQHRLEDMMDELAERRKA